MIKLRNGGSDQINVGDHEQNALPIRETQSATKYRLNIQSSKVLRKRQSEEHEIEQRHVILLRFCITNGRLHRVS